MTAIRLDNATVVRGDAEASTRKALADALAGQACPTTNSKEGHEA